ncbi:hypothetical protein [Vibrio bivalvicida]|uniref:Uncharacterized protein n=1 Tax=Vibrio bivalvicida TaxID=1276888 RepID=A0A177Y1T0_9VIBR|nr:hypothetical protein [Vibrio bivalvicida]OAJ94445.1 hypothetical protein APB76_09700 [Vibrio bivalvicida]
MAAQKLTRGRFVQIIIMLTLLIAAFTWRTVTFTNAQEIECELKPKCTFSVKNDQFSALKSEEKITLNKPSNNWQISTENKSVKIIESENNWQILGEQLDNLEIKLSDLEESQITGVTFRI